MTELSFFLSDLHLGVDAPENLYQSRHHEAALKAALRYMTRSARRVRDLVIHGDWFDPQAATPATRPPSLADIAAANPGVLEESRDGSGDFPSLIGSIRGRATYLNGNHDQFVGLGELNALLGPRCGRSLAGAASPVSAPFFERDGIFAEHGHMRSLIFRAASHARVSDPPFGTFITRLQSLLYAKELARQGKACVPELAGGFASALGVAAILFAGKELLELALREEGLAQAALDQALFLARETRDEVSFVLDDGSALRAGEVPARYPDLWTGLKDCHEALLVDATNSLGRAAEERLEAGARIVVMGHTHRALLRAERFPRDSVYVNSGFFCPHLAARASGERFPSFVEVEHRRDRDIVSLKKVDPAGRVSTLEAAAAGRRA
jgi:UDP-2,3-diacylglucosamine pyrophosphatase LpxH